MIERLIFKVHSLFLSKYFFFDLVSVLYKLQKPFLLPLPPMIKHDLIIELDCIIINVLLSISNSDTTLTIQFRLVQIIDVILETIIPISGPILQTLSFQ